MTHTAAAVVDRRFLLASFTEYIRKRVNKQERLRRSKHDDVALSGNACCALLLFHSLRLGLESGLSTRLGTGNDEQPEVEGAPAPTASKQLFFHVHGRLTLPERDKNRSIVFPFTGRPISDRCCCSIVE